MIEAEHAHRLSPAEREVLRLRVMAAPESWQVEGYRHRSAPPSLNHLFMYVIVRGNRPPEVSSTFVNDQPRIDTIETDL